MLDYSSERLNDVLRVIQICDSNFPIGSFNHSYGLETYLRSNKISDAEGMRHYLKVFLNSMFIYSDVLAIKILYEYLNKGEEAKIWDLDRLVTVQTIARETREGSKMVAGRMQKLFLELYDVKLLELYSEKIKAGNAFGHPALVFGILMHEFGFDMESAATFHMYSTFSTLIQNSVRAIPLGQKDGQLILRDMAENFKNVVKRVENMDYDFLGAGSPGIEISQINHETLEFRLFMS